jgi:hypothetical protein
MIDNVNQFLGAVAETDLAQAARRSARVIWNAHCTAFATTRVEALKVVALAIGEGQKLARRMKPATAARKTTRRSARRTTRRAA